MRLLSSILLVSLVAVASCGPDASPADPVVDAADIEIAEARANEDGSCKIRRIRNPRTGRIRPVNCVYDGLGYPGYADAYRFRPRQEFPDYDPGSNGVSMFSFEINADFSGILGVKEYTDDPIEGVPDVAQGFNANQPMTISFVGTRNRYGAFVLGGPGQFGRYEIQITERNPGAHACGFVIALQGDVSFDSNLTAGNSCQETRADIEWKAHHRYVFAEPGKSYTLRVEGLSPSFAPVIAAIAVDGTILTFDAGSLGGDTFREITFDLPLSYATVDERFVLLFVGQRINQSNGSYTLVFDSDSGA